jgi:hypothetical protein
MKIAKWVAFFFEAASMNARGVVRELEAEPAIKEETETRAMWGEKTGGK